MDRIEEPRRPQPAPVERHLVVHIPNDGDSIIVAHTVGASLWVDICIGPHETITIFLTAPQLAWVARQFLAVVRESGEHDE